MTTSRFYPRLAAALSIAVSPMHAFAVSDAWSQGDILSATAPQSGTGYGSAISADGDVVVVGQPRSTVNGIAGVGSADVWRHTATGWIREVTLLDQSPKAGAHFGAAVLVKGDTIYVSSPDQPNGTSTPGAGANEIFCTTHRQERGIGIRKVLVAVPMATMALRLPLKVTCLRSARRESHLCRVDSSASATSIKAIPARRRLRVSTAPPATNSNDPPNSQSTWIKLPGRSSSFDSLRTTNCRPALACNADK
jgi:hypothetical protein